MLTKISLHATLGSLRLTCKILATLRSTLRAFFYRVKFPATTDVKSRIEQMDMSTIYENTRCVQIIIPRLGPRNDWLSEIIQQQLPREFFASLRKIYAQFETNQISN